MSRGNRLRAADFWPADRRQRQALAQIDVAFCRALGRILFPAASGVIPSELCATWRAARRVLQARREKD